MPTIGAAGLTYPKGPSTNRIRALCFDIGIHFWGWPTTPCLRPWTLWDNVQRVLCTAGSQDVQSSISGFALGVLSLEVDFTRSCC